MVTIPAQLWCDHNVWLTGHPQVLLPCASLYAAGHRSVLNMIEHVVKVSDVSGLGRAETAEEMSD